MTTEPKKRDPFTDWRPAAGTRRDCGELELTIPIDRDNYFTITADPDTVAMVPVVLRQILAQPEPEGVGEGPPAAPPAPEPGEVAELVAALKADAECAEVEHYDLCNMTAEQMRRAATLL